MMKPRHAFTLVELSIVLVILGLLIGGVLTGQSLIRAAEIRSVATQFNQFLTASHTFRDKYMALPGDMPNAQSYWGIQNATPATCATTASTTALTCNGDGNGRLGAAPGGEERFRFWQHLANAGLIEGSYDGITHGSTPYSSTKENSPAGKLSGGIWFAGFLGTRSGDINLFEGDYGNAFTVGKPVPNDTPSTGMKAEEVYNIDMKVDDGKPATGRMVSLGNFASCTDATVSTTLTANYLLSATNNNCTAAFRQLF